MALKPPRRGPKHDVMHAATTETQATYRRAGWPLFGVLVVLDTDLAVTSARGTAVTLAIARQAGIDVDPATMWAFLLRDIGTLDVPARILQKPGALTASERKVVQSHSARTAQLLEEVAFLAPAAHIARHHHERWDGTGYPDRLAGSDIPLASRALAIGDAFVALTAPRPYRPARTFADAIAIVSDGAGSAFDPELAGLLPAVADSLPARIARQPAIHSLAGAVRLEDTTRRARDLSRGQLEALFGAAVGLPADAAASRCHRSTGTHRNWMSSLRRALACPERRPLQVFLATAASALIDALGLELRV